MMVKVLSDDQKEVGFHKRDPKYRKKIDQKLNKRQKTAERDAKRRIGYAQQKKQKELLQVQKDRGAFTPQLTRQEKREILMMDHRVRRRLFKTVDEFCNVCNEYFQKIKEKNTEIEMQNRWRKTQDRMVPIPYTFSGLLLSIGITKSTFNRYETHDKFKEFHQPAQVARMIIEDQLLTGGIKREFNPQMIKFYLQNITGLREHILVEKEETIDHKITFITVHDHKELKQIQEKLNLKDMSEDEMEFEENEEPGKRIVVSNVIDIEAKQVKDEPEQT